MLIQIQHMQDKYYINALVFQNIAEGTKCAISQNVHVENEHYINEKCLSDDRRH